MAETDLRRVAIFLLMAVATVAAEAPKRLVVIKADGLPADKVDRFARLIDPKTGRSALPWIEHVFLQRGSWVRNYYTRGISLSAPAWSMLDTGQHSVIRGNAEFDRFTLQVYDYLNFFPFYVGNARSRRADMPSVEVLDQAGIPLLIDAFDPGERYQSLQLFQRGVRWRTLGSSARNRVTSRSVRELFDEWQTGFELGETLNEQVERELIARLMDEHTNYLDYFFGDYDHVMHLVNDEASLIDVIKKLDGLVGRLWSAIQRSPRAADTIFVLISDHGMNSDPAVLSQGFNLIKYFNSKEGGGHHVVTNRHPLTDYKLRGLDPFVEAVTSASSESLYLTDRASEYPTALLDLDGNERASVHLRNSDLNRLQQLLQQFNHPQLTPESKAGLKLKVLEILDRNRASWTRTVNELDIELGALARAIKRQGTLLPRLPRKFARADRDEQLDEEPKRERALLENWQRDERSYREYVVVLRRLLALTPAELEPGKMRVDSLIPHRSMGDSNSIRMLQNYAAGPTLTLDYFARLTGLRVRNNVQAGVGAAPVDFVAAKVDAAGVASLHLDGPAVECAVFVYADAAHQALILSGEGKIRYLPVAHLAQDENGSLHFDEPGWSAGFPLHLFEDAKLEAPGDRGAWLSAWHTEAEWLRAVHRTTYSNGIIGLTEHFGPLRLGENSPLWRDAGGDTAVLRRFALRQRRLVQADLLVLASNHWNFNVRGFNPGGNHGSFFRVSTHSTLLLAGGGVPVGKVIETPYDSLSFVPTIQRLAGLAKHVQLDPEPDRVIQELVR